MFPVDQSQKAQLDHVPWGAVLIAHQIQSHGHVGVAVVAAEVVLWGQKTKKEEEELTRRLLFAWEITQTVGGERLLTILCLYSSEASCTAVSQALEPLAYTLLTSSIQYLQSEGRRRLLYFQRKEVFDLWLFPYATTTMTFEAPLTLLVFQRPCCLPV